MVSFRKQTQVSIVGAGKVGTIFAILLYRAGYRIASVISRKRDSSRKLARLVYCQNFSDSLADINPSTVILVFALPEESISGVCDKISANTKLNFRKLIVFHTSGSLTSDVLFPFIKKGARVFSLHPIQSFANKSTINTQLIRMKDAFYGFEGNTQVFKYAARIVKDIRGRIVRIPKERKILYHTACVFASNYSVVLLEVVSELLKSVRGSVRLKHVEALVKSSIENAFQLNPRDALTGPIVRGSIETVKKQMLELIKTDKRIAILYKELGMFALDIAERRKNLSPNTLKQIRKILSNK